MRGGEGGSDHTEFLFGACKKDLLLECFVELRGPVVVLGFGAELALLVSEVRPDGVDFHERPEHGVGLPADVVHSHHCRAQRKDRT